MLSTSLDILNLVLALCIIVLTVFIAWAIYYFVVSVQRINRITKRIESGVSKVEELIGLAKNKLNNSSTNFLILSELAKKAMEFVQEKRQQKKAEKQTKQTSKKK